MWIGALHSDMMKIKAITNKVIANKQNIGNVIGQKECSISRIVLKT